MNTRTSISRSTWGEIDGRPVERFVLTNGTISTAILSFGAIIQELHVPDRHGETANVVLGFDNLDQYIAKNPHFGSVLGRFANRIGGARFTLDGSVYELTPNKGTFTAHGGAKPFDRYIWQADIVETDCGSGVKLTHTSPDGDEGFPGEFTVTVTYLLTPDQGLRLGYTATTTKPTVQNLTNHSYFNLGGEASGTVENQLLTIHATHYTPTGPDQIPTGEIAPLAGTGLDFSTPRPIGDAVRDGADPQIRIARGVDHNYVITRDPGTNELVSAARLVDPDSGRMMDVETTMPGMQVYTSNSLDGALAGYSGRLYRQTDAICFETQQFPDAPNHPEFPSAVLRPDEEFHSTTIYRFSTVE
ncbi:MAG TPA: aldose epimerase family protein [Thermomicrobiales bacterium]|nr:aldose epimerase family protein [Thermomicrobiales bacterium]